MNIALAHDLYSNSQLLEDPRLDSPQGRIVLILEYLLKQINVLIAQNPDRKKFKARNQALIALYILTESLDQDQNQELCARLSKIYDFVHISITNYNVALEDLSVSEQIVSDLVDTWNEMPNA